MNLKRSIRKLSLSVLIVHLAVLCICPVSPTALSLPPSISDDGLAVISSVKNQESAIGHFQSAAVKAAKNNNLEYRARLAAGLNHSAMINYDGSVYLWGDNSYGQAGLKQTDYADHPIRLEWDQTAADISLGAYHSLILTDDGQVYAFGRNVFGQLGNQTVESTDQPAVVEGLPKITAISAGALHSMALAEDGSIWAWGNNSDLQIGNVPDQVIEDASGNVVGRRCLSPVKIIDEGAAAISAGGSHSLYLDSNGQVFSWGANDRGQLGNGTTQSSGQPAPVTGLDQVDMISAGYQHNLALIRRQGELDQIWAWGDDSFGQSGLSSDFSQSPFRTLPSAIDFTSQLDISSDWFFASIAAGTAHSAAIVKQEIIDNPAPAVKEQIFFWGSNSHGQLAIGEAPEISPRPVPLNMQYGDHNTNSFAAFDALALGGHHTLLLSSRGLLAAAGRGDAGQLGTYSVINRFILTEVETPDVIYPAFREGSQLTASWGSNNKLTLLWPAAQDNTLSDIFYRVLIRHPGQAYEQWDVGLDQSLELSSFSQEQPLEIILTVYDQARQDSDWSDLSRLALYHIPGNLGNISPVELFEPVQFSVYQSMPYPHNWKPEPDMPAGQPDVPWRTSYSALKIIRPAADWKPFIIAIVVSGLLLLSFMADLKLRRRSAMKTAGK